MTGYFKITKLDFFTMKSQLPAYLSLVFIVLVFGFMGSPFAILSFTGAWVVALLSSNIFVIQEKNGLDRLYGSVSVGLRDIVLGRYIYVFLSYFSSFLAIIAIGFGFALFKGKALELADILMGFGTSFLAFSVITGIQMPLFFKMGYTKAKIWSIVPFMAVVSLVLAPSFVPAVSDAIAYMLSNQGVLTAGSILAGCIIQFLSYKTAIVAYRKQR